MHKQLSKKEIKELNEKIKSQFNIEDFFDKRENLEQEANEFTTIKRGNMPIFIVQENLIPTLKLLLERQFLPIVTVDMGAVKFITSGADVMRPGIKEISQFSKDALVCIVDINNKKPLAVGKALFSSEEMAKQQSGKVIKNIHYVGDKIWQIT